FSRLVHSYLFILRPPPISPLFPYTTLFRSVWPRLSHGARRPSTGDQSVLLGHFHRLGHDGPRPDPRANLSPRHWQRRCGFCRFRSEEHTSELQSLRHLVCRLLLEKKKISVA